MQLPNAYATNDPIRISGTGPRANVSGRTTDIANVPPYRQSWPRHTHRRSAPTCNSSAPSGHRSPRTERPPRTSGLYFEHRARLRQAYEPPREVVPSDIRTSEMVKPHPYGGNVGRPSDGAVARMTSHCQVSLIAGTRQPNLSYAFRRVCVGATRTTHDPQGEAESRFTRSNLLKAWLVYGTRLLHSAPRPSPISGKIGRDSSRIRPPLPV